MIVIVDTGVLLAAADADDADHERCAELLRAHFAVVRPRHVAALDLIP